MRAQLAVALIEGAEVGLGLGVADLVRPPREVEDPERGVDLHVLRDGASGAGEGAVVDAERGVGLARLNEKGDDVDVRLVAVVVGLEGIVEPLQGLAVTTEEVEQLADLDGRLGRLGDVLAPEVLDHQPLPADERASPGGRRSVAITGCVEGVAQEAVQPRAPLDGADGVLRRSLGAHGVETLADDSGGARRIAALERQVGQLHRHLGRRFALLARAKKKRLRPVDEARVDVAARQLEVDVGVAHLHLRAGETALGVGETPLEIVGLRVRRRVALRIEAQPQADEVELDQLRRDLAVEVARRRVGVEHRLRLLEPPDGQEVRRQQARDVAVEDEEVEVRGVRAEARLEDPERHHRIGGLGGGPAQEVDPGQEPTRQRQIVGRGGVGLGRGDEQGAQLGIVAVIAGQLARHLRRPGGRIGDPAGAQVGARHAGDRPLHLVAVRQQQLAERPPTAVARRRVVERGGEPLLPCDVELVEAQDHRGGRPVAERALEGVDGAPAPVHAAPFVEVALLFAPVNDLIEPLLPFVLGGGDRRQRCQRQHRLLIAAARRIERDDQLGRRAQHARLLGRHPRRRCPELARIEEPQRISEGREDRLVDVVALELARLAPDVVQLEHQHRIEEVVEELRAQREPLGAPPPATPGRPAGLRGSRPRRRSRRCATPRRPAPGRARTAAACCCAHSLRRCRWPILRAPNPRREPRPRPRVHVATLALV